MNPNQTDNTEFRRRDFLKGGAFATLMAMLGGVELIAQPAPETPEAKPVGPITKVAVIGLGPWGREILDQLGRMPQVEIAVICDNYPTFLNRSAKKWPDAKAVADYKEVLANKDIQAVVIATPTHQHKEITLAAIAVGKHVYCEAPLAHTIEDAKAIALAANDSGVIFQSGLQMRSDPQRLWLLPFIRSGALGKPVQARSQWNKKQSWRATSPNPDREKAINWRLDKATSLGLAGEIGIHQLDQSGWFFLNQLPVAVSGHGSTILWTDGRNVPDTAQLIVEYPGGVRLTYNTTLANSFDADYEIYYGSDAAVMIRESKAWMFKEVDSPLLGWEVYARKDSFYKETGIALIAGGSKQDTLAASATSDSPFPFPTHYYALEAFVGNCGDVEDFKSSFGSVSKAQTREYLASIKLRPAATALDGYVATVIAIKANEAITSGSRIELSKSLFELA